MQMLPTEHSEDSLKVAALLQRIWMAWIAFGVVIVLFVIVLVLALYCTFVGKYETVVKVCVWVVDGVVGLSLRQIIAHLFPAGGPPIEPAK